MLPCQPKWNACTDCHPRDRGSAPVTPALAAAWLGGLHAERLASPKPQAIGNLSGCASTFRGICSGLSADALVIEGYRASKKKRGELLRPTDKLALDTKNYTLPFKLGLGFIA